MQSLENQVREALSPLSVKNEVVVVVLQPRNANTNTFTCSRRRTSGKNWTAEQCALALDAYVSGRTNEEKYDLGRRISKGNGAMTWKNQNFKYLATDARHGAPNASSVDREVWEMYQSNRSAFNHLLSHAKKAYGVI